MVKNGLYGIVLMLRVKEVKTFFQVINIIIISYR